MRRIIPIFVLAACGGSPHLNDVPDGGSNTADAAPGVITPTAQGTPIGTPVTTTIDPADGVDVTSSDGGLALHIPGGAVATPTQITITPITGEAPLGQPTAWRIDPAGTVLAVPAHAVIHLTADVAHQDDTGTLFLASQDAQGYWNAGNAAAWDDTTTTATADAPNTLGDWALTSCVALTADSELAASAPAHLSVMRQCDAPPASGKIGATVVASDPVVWSDAAEGGGAALGTLAPSGATATLTPPSQPPQSGIPVDVVTATVSSSTIAPSFTAPRQLVLDNHVAIASYAQWTLEGTTYSAILGSSAISHAGSTQLSLADNAHAATLSIGFPGDRTGTFTAATVNAEVSGGSSGNDLRYADHYNVPCDPATIKTLQTEVSVTSARKDLYQMHGVFEGTLAIQRGMVQCPSGPSTDVVEVPLNGAFRLMWQQI